MFRCFCNQKPTTKPHHDVPILCIPSLLPHYNNNNRWFIASFRQVVFLSCLTSSETFPLNLAGSFTNPFYNSPPNQTLRQTSVDEPPYFTCNTLYKVIWLQGLCNCNSVVDSLSRRRGETDESMTNWMLLLELNSFLWLSTNDTLSHHGNCWGGLGAVYLRCSSWPKCVCIDA